jgi:hypothetical protein
MSACPKPVPAERKPPKRLRAKNAKNAADTFARCYHSEERVEFVQTLPCIVPGCTQPSENAHIEGDGTSRKAGYEKIAPICKGHHTTRRDSLHNVGREEFEGTHLVDLAALALDTERIWRRYAGR